MKYVKILSILLCCSVIFFYACNDKSKKQLPKTRTASPATLEPPQNEAGVWHFTCIRGCAGGAGAAVQCETCGSPLVHNNVYHGNANTTPTPTAPYNNAPYATPPPAGASPNQNSAGIWHYTCENGCAGGSGSPGNCSTCGGKLAHNQAYHQ